ncbi:MAG: HAD family phosphatase [Bacteroidota bacterium]
MSEKFAVIFDMDGVLIDSNPFHKKSLNIFAEKYGHHLSDEELRLKVYGRPNKDWISRLFEKQLNKDQLFTYGEEKEAIFRDIYSHHIKPVNGLMKFLDRLRSLEIEMAIATSAPRSNIDFLFEHIDIKSYFPVVLDESDVSRGKPDPEVYLKAAERLGYSPDRCIVFEDSLSGVESAYSAGCKVVGVRTTHQEDEFKNVVLTVDDFDDTHLIELRNLLF